MIFTDTAKETKLKEFYTDVDGIRPGSIEEYNMITGKALGIIAEEFGIGKVVYDIRDPEDAPLPLGITEDTVLYDSFAECESEPLCFDWSYAVTGRVSFKIYDLKGSDHVTEYKDVLFKVFRILFHIISGILFDLWYFKLTTCDMFTGIPNLSSLIKFCQKMIDEGRLGDYTAFSFNIRNFKSIHQSLSYLEGSKVTEMYCRIVSEAVTEKEIVARIGGDNFVAVVLNENSDYFLDLINNMVVKYPKEDRVFTFSFGATAGAMKLGEEKNPGEIMMHVSTAYQSARENRLRLCYYDKNVELSLLEQKIILSRFFPAVAAREFTVMYQPKVSVKDKTLCGAEALVRWVRPEGGMVMPGSFIPVLEKDGCICRLDFYVLEEVCRFQKRMMEEGIEPVKISVNFSKRHLSNNKLVEEIVETIDLYGIPHEYIEVELTESENFRNNDVMKDIVNDLNSFGIKTSIDDFGTGYSSLGMLRTLRFDTLKIDRSFIPNSEKDMEKSLMMLRGMVNLAKSLGLTTVAEGVETKEQLDILESMDCDVIQGYFFDKPLPEAEFISRLRQRRYAVGT